MKVLVTGGTGFLGRHLVPALLAQGHEVTALGSAAADLRREDSLQPWANTPFDRIYHLAAWTKAGDFCLRHPGEQWVVNQHINTRLLEFWQSRQPQATLISMGTSCAYPPELELREDNYLVGEPDRDLYSYAMTKRMLLVGQQALARQFGLRWVHLIPSTLYGPKFELSDSHFIFDLIKKIHAGKTQGVPVVLWGDGSQIRELVYVDDAVELIEASIAANTERSGGLLLNLASEAGHTIRDYAEQICAVLDFDPDRITYDINAFTGVRKKVLSTAKARSMFPDFEWTSLRDGLSRTIADYAERVGRS